MKAIPYKLLFLGMLVVIAQTILFAGGSEVEVSLKNGAKYKGELLAVRDSALLISAKVGSDEEILSKNSGLITVLRTDSIMRIVEEGHSHVLVGMGVGLVAGVVLGGALGSSESKSDNQIENMFTQPVGAALYAAAGGLVGLGAGAVVGIASSSSDQEYRVSSPSGRAILRLCSRYPTTEPSFLQHVR